MRGRDPAAQLVRALSRRAGDAAILTHDGMTPWCSATFVGAQHQLTVAGDTDWTDGLVDADLLLHGCFVASIDVARTASGATLTVLVLDE